jgi:trigger factor
VVDLGTGRLVPELEQALVGMQPGETREVRFERGEDATGTVELTLKELKERVLPPLDDDLARSASEFDTLDELRSQIESRLREQLEEEIEGAVRAAAVDRLVEASGVEAGGPLVEARARTLLNNLARSLAARGVDLETYVAVSGTSAEQLSAQIRGEAAQSVARELVLDAVADRVGIEVPDGEVEALVREEAQAAGDDPDALIESLKAHGTFEDLREDIRLRAALDRVAAEVKRIPVELAEARDAIWTPEKEKREAPTKLWTPGTKEIA